MLKKIFSFALLAAVMFSAVSCSDDNNDPTGPVIPDDAIYDIVTLVSTNATTSTFAAQKSENSPEVQYVCGVSLINYKELKPGTRLLIAYKMQNGAAPYTPGAITLYGFSTMSNTEASVLTGTSEQYNGWDTEPLKMTSMWLTGIYLNIDAEMFASTSARPTSYILVADESTLDKPVVETHLILKSNNSDGGNLARLYASFNIQDLFAISTCKTIRVNYKDISGYTYKDINKPTETERPLD